MGSGLSSSQQRTSSSTNSTGSIDAAAPSWMNGGQRPLRSSEYLVEASEGPPRFTIRKSMPSTSLERAKDEELKHREDLLTCRDLKHSSVSSLFSHNEKATERRIKDLHETTSADILHDGRSLRRTSSLPAGTHVVVDRQHQSCAAELVDGTCHKMRKKYLLTTSFLEDDYEPSEPEGCGMDTQESNDTTAMVGGGRWTASLNTQISKPYSQSFTIRRPTIPVECSSMAAEQSSYHFSQYHERILTPLLEETMEINQRGFPAENSSPSKDTPKLSSSRQQQPMEDNQQQVSTFNAATAMSPGNCIIISNHKNGNNSLIRSFSTNCFSKDVQVVQNESSRRVKGELSSTFHSLQSLYSPTKKIYHSQSAIGLRSLLHPSLDKQMLVKVPLLTVTRPDEPPCYSHLPPSLRNKNDSSSCIVHKNRQYLDVL
nr:unnamed protein product [Naegleria fowleri]